MNRKKHSEHTKLKISKSMSGLGKKLKKSDIDDIRLRFKAGFKVSQIHKLYKSVSRQTIYCILNEKTWK